MPRVVRLTPEGIVDEICAVTGWPRADVAARVEAERQSGGANVCADARRFGVTWHEFDSAMERLYRETDGFVYETMVFWSSGSRPEWIARAEERLALRCREDRIGRENARVLVWGDGTGSDSIALAHAGWRPDVLEYPGSRTFEFLSRRLAHHRLLGQAVQVITDDSALRPGSYDAIVCFEVLEHVPEPRRTIARLAELLRPGGVALVTEGFREVSPGLPTHLRKNLRYAGRTPFLFREAGLHLTWFADRPRFKPSEYRKLERPGLRERAELLHPRVLKHWVAAAGLRRRA